jgi:MraZ protein
MLDDKGRLSIPSSIRTTLHKLYAPHATSLVVTRFFERCLVAYPEPEWLALQDQLANMPNEESSRAFLRHFYASAHVCTLDRQGRILLPPKLREYAGLDTEVHMFGLMKKLELWSPQHWEAYEASETSRFDTNEHVKALRL